MNEEQRQRISALCDGELEARERLDAIDDIGRDPALRDTFGRYQMISDVLHNNYRRAEDHALLARVREALADEPTVLAPPRRTPRFSSWRPLAAGFAVAASVAAVAVVGIQVINEEPAAQLAAEAPREYIRLQQPTVVAEKRERAREGNLNIAPVAARSKSPLAPYVVNHNEVSRIPMNNPQASGENQ